MEGRNSIEIFLGVSYAPLIRKKIAAHKKRKLKERDDLPGVKAHLLAHWARRDGHPRDRRGDGREFPWMEEISYLVKIRLGGTGKKRNSSKSSLGLATPL